MLKTGLLSLLLLCAASQVVAQIGYGYGSVIGGDLKQKSGPVSSFLNDNEEGIRIVLIRSSGGGLRGGGGGSVRVLEVPKDTDYLELIMLYSGIDPRTIRKDKFDILRIASTGQSPFLSKDIQRYWTTYNFEEQYDRGGPFDLVRPGDIIVVQGRGLINRPIFDPLTDLTFLLTLPTVVLSVITVYNTFIR